VTTIAELDCAITPTTDGEIAIINLESARQRSWAKLFADPTRHGVVETVVEHEQLTLQFVGDVSALGRVEALAAQLKQIDAASARVALIQAQVASMAHRFSDARHYLAQAEIGGAPTADVDRLRLNIDQACGSNLDSVLDARRSAATETNGLEVFVALGPLLADLISATSMWPIVLTKRPCKHAATSRRFLLPGFSFNSACFGVNSPRRLVRPLPPNGIGGQSRSCRCTQKPVYIWPRFIPQTAVCTTQRRYFDPLLLLAIRRSIGVLPTSWPLKASLKSPKRA
jgi:hypothetical protein